jgi:hypothetical protein
VREKKKREIKEEKKKQSNQLYFIGYKMLEKN